MHLRVNNRIHAVPPEWQGETLLHVLREALGLVGCKFGCGVGLCGACTVLVDGHAQRSCVLPVSTIGAAAVTTVEALPDGERLHPVQQAWLDQSVPQCGYCQAGQIMGAVALLRAVPNPSEAQVDEAMSAHLCRCGTQQRIRMAVRQAAAAKP